MATEKPLSLPEKTLEKLLDEVDIAREHLTSIERTLERLRIDIANSRKPNNGSGKRR
jgi:hypothetical protein